MTALPLPFGLETVNGCRRIGTGFVKSGAPFTDNRPWAWAVHNVALEQGTSAPVTLPAYRASAERWFFDSAGDVITEKQVGSTRYIRYKSLDFFIATQAGDYIDAVMSYATVHNHIIYLVILQADYAFVVYAQHLQEAADTGYIFRRFLSGRYESSTNFVIEGWEQDDNPESATFDTLIVTQTANFIYDAEQITGSKALLQPTFNVDCTALTIGFKVGWTPTGTKVNFHEKYYGLEFVIATDTVSTVNVAGFSIPRLAKITAGTLVTDFTEAYIDKNESFENTSPSDATLYGWRPNIGPVLAWHNDFGTVDDYYLISNARDNHQWTGKLLDAGSRNTAFDQHYRINFTSSAGGIPVLGYRHCWKRTTAGTSAVTITSSDWFNGDDANDPKSSVTVGGVNFAIAAAEYEPEEAPIEYAGSQTAIYPYTYLAGSDLENVGVTSGDIGGEYPNSDPPFGGNNPLNISFDASAEIFQHTTTADYPWVSDAIIAAKLAAAIAEEQQWWTDNPLATLGEVTTFRLIHDHDDIGGESHDFYYYESTGSQTLTEAEYTAALGATVEFASEHTERLKTISLAAGAHTAFDTTLYGSWDRDHNFGTGYATKPPFLWKQEHTVAAEYEVHYPIATADRVTVETLGLVTRTTTFFTKEWHLSPAITFSGKRKFWTARNMAEFTYTNNTVGGYASASSSLTATLVGDKLDGWILDRTLGAVVVLKTANATTVSQSGSSSATGNWYALNTYNSLVYAPTPPLDSNSQSIVDAANTATAGTVPVSPTNGGTNVSFTASEGRGTIYAGTKQLGILYYREFGASDFRGYAGSSSEAYTFTNRPSSELYPTGAGVGNSVVVAVNSLGGGSTPVTAESDTYLSTDEYLAHYPSLSSAYNTYSETRSRSGPVASSTYLSTIEKTYRFNGSVVAETTFTPISKTYADTGPWDNYHAGIKINGMSQSFTPLNALGTAVITWPAYFSYTQPSGYADHVTPLGATSFLKSSNGNDIGVLTLTDPVSHGVSTFDPAVTLTSSSPDVIGYPLI